jgi:methionine-rich copper-binding protein CopC
MRSLSRTLALLATLFLCLETCAPAQVFQLTGGTSTGFQAQGAGLTIRGQNYEAWSGAGISEGKLVFGSFLKFRLHQYTLKLGNDDATLALPTDSLSSPTTLHMNGVSIEHQSGHTTLHLSLGQAGTAFTSPMFRAGTSSGPLTGVLFVDTMLAPSLRLFSRNIVSTIGSTHTSISGFEWKPRGSIACLPGANLFKLGELTCELDKSYTLSFAAGVGSGHLYTAQSLLITRPSLDLKLAYVTAADGFQLALAGSPLQSQLDGLNVTAVIRPHPSTSFAFGHQAYLVPQLNQQATLHSKVDRASGSWNISEQNRTSVGTALFRSKLADRDTLGASLWASQSVGPLDLRLNYLVSASPSLSPAQPIPAVQAVSLTTQEKISPHFSALQVTTYSAGRTNVAFGGSLLTNLLTAAVNYQTLYVPFRPDHPFTQALSVTINLNLFGNVHLSTATSFTPQGKIVYTLAGSGSYYRSSEFEAAPQFQSSRLQHYLIQGQVTTSDGHPVSGAAIRIGKETLYSDRDGHFFARQRKAGSYKVEVLPKEFIAIGEYTVLSAPLSATATKNDIDPGILIVLQRS